MIPFKINGKTYQFPTRWEDVTYAQYIGLLRCFSLTDQIALFMGVPRETIQNAELKNLEKINLCLAFLSISPKFEKTRLVGPYFVPDDITIQSLAQFEALRGLLTKMPKETKTLDSWEEISDLYLHACAIYCQKQRDREFDFDKATKMKDELKHYSCAEVIGTGAFFLFKPLNTSKHIRNRFLSLLLRLKKLIQGLPGYQKTLGFLQPSTGRRGK